VTGLAEVVACSSEDRRYLRLACRLALKGAGRTSPNPIVGAVLVRNGRVVGSGFHQLAGGDHAEIVALKRAGAKAKGATLYINLEPCSHFGRTPPCSDALIRAGVKEVVAGMRDPDPRVSGKGFRALRRAGIRVRVGVLEPECRRLNEAFCKFITRRQPFVILKLAATLDGKIATVTGDARWISDADSRQAVHRLRNQVDAVLVGAGTALMDDPQLTCRIPGGRNPWRIVLDGRLRLPVSAKVLRRPDPDKTIIATGTRVAQKRLRAIESAGTQVWKFSLREGNVPWIPLLKKLAQREIVSVMIEGGATTAASALKHRIVDKILFYYAPKIFGGDGRAMIDSLSISRVEQSLRIRQLQFQKSGTDLFVSGYL
jgi:diaminohydroxyphosphoribosylaminopyrimidine deaminase/5-amino-6-(5-phosphoribosylamino)uracil reductase